MAAIMSCCEVGCVGTTCNASLKEPKKQKKKSKKCERKSQYNCPRPLFGTSMVSLVVAVRDVKQRCAEAARQGIRYHDLLVELSIQPAVGLYIAKNFLVQDGFVFRTPEYEITIDASITLLPMDTFVFAPSSMYREAYGFESHEENIPNFQPGQATPSTDLLASLGVHGTNGMLANEIDAKYGDRKAFGSLLDKLVLSGVVVKRLVTPLEGLRSPRTSNSITIYHLKRYAKDYAVWKDNLTVQPESCIRNNIGLLLRQLMDHHQIDLVSTRVIVAMFKMNHRILQYFRAQMMQLEKTGESLPIRFVEAPFASYLPSNPRNCAKFRVGWCIVRGSLTGNFDADPLPSHYPDIQFSTFQHLSLMEQIDFRVSRAGDQGITGGDIRRYSGYARKRATRVSEDMIANKQLGYGYPSAKFQEGKTLMNRILPKYPVNVLIPAWLASSNRKQRMLSVLDNNSNSNSVSSYEANNFRNARTDSGLENILGPAPTAATFPITETSEEGSGLPTHFPTNAQISGKVLVLQLSRDAWILHLLSQQPFFVCSLYDVKHMINRQMAERGSQTLIDKRTLTRCMQSLEERGFLCSRSIDKKQDIRIRDIFHGRIPVACFYALELTHPDAARFCRMLDREEEYSTFVSVPVDDRIEQFLQQEHRLWFARGSSTPKRSSIDDSDEGSIENIEELLDSDSEEGSSSYHRTNSRTRKSGITVAKELFPVDRSTSATKRKRKSADEVEDYMESDEEYISTRRASRNKLASQSSRDSVNDSDNSENKQDNLDRAKSSTQKKRRVGNKNSNNNSSMDNNTDTTVAKNSGRKRSLAAVENTTVPKTASEDIRFVRLVGVIVKDESSTSKSSRKLQHAKKDGFVPLSAILKQPTSNNCSSLTSSNTIEVTDVVASLKRVMLILSETNASHNNLTGKKQLPGSEQSGSDEYWSLEDDIQLLERLVVSLCVRGGRLGLPILLKSTFWRKMMPHFHHLLTDNQYILLTTDTTPSQTLMLVPTVTDFPRSFQQTVHRKDDFHQHIWDSSPFYIDMDYNQVDLTHLRSSYLLSKVIKTANMSVSACRRHLPLLIKHLSQMSDVCGNPGAGGIGSAMMTGHLTLKRIVTRLLFFRGDISGFYLPLLQQSQSESQPPTSSKTITSMPKKGSIAATTKEKDYNTMNSSPFDVLSFIDTIRFLFWQERQADQDKLQALRDDRAQTVLQRIFKNVEVPDFETKEEEEEETSDIGNTFSVEDIAGVITYGTPEVFEKHNILVSGEEQDYQDTTEEAPSSIKKSRLSLRQLVHKSNAPTPQKLYRMPFVALVTSDHVLAVQLLRDLYIHMVLVRQVGVSRPLLCTRDQPQTAKSGPFHGALHENDATRFRGTNWHSDDDYNPLVTEFGFSVTFLQSMTLERPLGSFFYDYCKAPFQAVSETARLGENGASYCPENHAYEGTSRTTNISAGLSDEYRDASKLLHLATAMSRCALDSGVFYQPEEESASSGLTILPASQMGIAVEVFGNVSDHGVVAEEMNLSLQQPQRRYMVVNELTQEDTISQDYEKAIPENMSYARNNDMLLSGVNTTTNSVGTISTGNNRRACDRVVCHVQYEQESTRSDLTMRLLRLLDPALLPVEHQKDRPWVEVDARKTDKYQYKIPVLQYFTTQILAYLGENPGATVSHLHALLMFLPLVAVQELVSLLVQVGILEERHAEVSVTLNDCFGAWDTVWNDSSVSSNSYVDPNLESVFYEIAV